MIPRPTHRRPAWPAAALALGALASACASGAASHGAGAATESQAASAAPAPARAPAAAADAPAAPSARGQRLFEEAVASREDQRKLRVPTDWELLERKWRAAAAEGIPEAWFDVGVTLEQQGKPAEARAAYQRALALRPGFREAAVNLAFAEAAGAEPREAARLYAEVLQRFPDDAPARVRLAGLYRDAGQLDEAWRLSREALQRDPAVPGAYRVMMRVAVERGNLDLAELIAVRARKIDPDDPEVAWLLGAVQERRGDEGAALAQYRRALSKHPEHLPSRLRLLELMMAARSWEGAAEQARAVLQRTPDDARVQLALGVALRNLGKVDEALAAYDRAAALGGAGLPEVLLARGAALARGKGDCAAALPWLERYESAVGPAVALDSPAPGLRRECNAQIASARQAEEAARQMQAEAARKSAAPAAAPAAGAAATGTAPPSGTPSAPQGGSPSGPPPAAVEPAGAGPAPVAPR